MPSSPSLFTQHLLIRPARHDDAAALHRLAALDSRRAPRGRVLLAECDGELRAALATGDGHVVADPFTPTAHLVAMLRAGARALGRGTL
ncbi:MAG TPA: hypothetical protein VNT03_00605 [Baekduia sp.]|nr:hypothetical protein [Baekduia sp.]